MLLKCTRNALSHGHTRPYDVVRLRRVTFGISGTIVRNRATLHDVSVIGGPLTPSYDVLVVFGHVHSH